MGLIKRYGKEWGAPLLYGVVGGGIIFVCLSFVALSNKHMENIERIGNEQVEAFENTGNKQTKALENLSSEQRKILDKLIRATPTRPYFTQALAKMYKVTSGEIYLTVSVQNNNVPANGVVSHLLVLRGSLDRRMGPLHSNRVESANPIGPGGTHSHHWGPISVPANAIALFVVLQVRYTHALTGEVYSQPLFLKFHGSSESGIFVNQLFNATGEEKKEIQRYMEQRGISAL